MITVDIYIKYKNRMILSKLKNKIYELSKLHNLFFTHVKGHSTNAWNDIADFYADKGGEGFVKCDRWERMEMLNENANKIST